MTQEQWGAGLAAAQDNLEAGITGEHKALMCPYKLGPCWEHQCQMWKLVIEDCGLKRLEPQDAVIAELKAHLAEVDDMLKAETEAGERYEARAQQLEIELGNRPTREGLRNTQERGDKWQEQALKAEKELADARQELEALRAQGGRRSRRKKESSVGEL